MLDACPMLKGLPDKFFALPEMVKLGLGRIVALYDRSSTLCQIHYHIRCLYF
jgi:hypothetical protein